MSINQTSKVVGARDKVVMSFKSPLPLKDGDLILLTVPAAATKNLDHTLKACESGLGNKLLADKLDCVLIGINQL
jgi:hypothetical protein